MSCLRVNGVTGGKRNTQMRIKESFMKVVFCNNVGMGEKNSIRDLEAFKSDSVYLLSAEKEGRYSCILFTQQGDDR